MKRILSLMLALSLILSVTPLTPFAAVAAAEQVFALPSGLQEVEEQAFAGNTSITTLVIPNGVTSIGSEAFEGCTGLTDVSIASMNVVIANDAFKNCSRDIVFYAHNGSTAMLWAMAHGYKCVSLDDDSDHLARFSAMIAHSGFDPSLLMSNTFASKCLIVRTPSNMDRLPDISEYNPVDIFRSDDHLYYIQFGTEDSTEDCFGYLNSNSGIRVEPDRVGASDDVSAQGVTIAENWGTNDTMGFDVYAPFVAQHRSGNVTIAVIDSGVNESAWGGQKSPYAISFVGGSAYSDSARHGSKVASIINDCLGSNKSSVTLLPIKVVNSSSMYRTSVIIEGIKHASSHGANIINMSLGWDASEGTSPEIEHQLSVASSKGILIVAAAGNGSGNVMYPASCSGVLAVSALAYSTESGYSVRSRTGSAIDYTAPGMHLTTSAYSPVDAAGDIIGTASTSFAAPQITAALALISLDSKHGGSPTTWLNKCCIAPEGVSSSAYGHGLPQLEKLKHIDTIDIELYNIDGGEIPSRLWLGDKGNDFMLGWNIIPDDATNQTITVNSNKNSVVSVRKYGNMYALITAKGTGEAVVSVSNGEITKEINIVVEKPVTEILITGTNGTMIVGKELDLAVSVLEENATNRAVQWRSSDENVLSVSDTGHLTALAAGKVTITCEALDGFGTKGQVEITVIEVPDATDISLSAEEKDISSGRVTLAVGETLTLIPEILPAEAPQECRYSFFPKGYVTVTDEGVVEAVSPGTATIVATATTGQNVYTGLSVTVVIYPESVSISADKTTLNPEETIVLTAEVLPETATDKTVTWSSRNTAVATVNSKTGKVTALTPGTAEIVCTTSNGLEGTITLTVRQPITITFDAAGGNCSEPSRPGYSGYAIGNLPVATRNYWFFDGWYTAASGGTRVSATTEFTENTTVYAHWNGYPYNVVFNPNGGICSTTTMNARVGTKLGTLPAAAKDNYTFAGWYTSADEDEGTKITADYIQNNNSYLTVYAHWTANPYTIKFSANGGVCDTEEMTGTVDKPIGILPQATRKSYIFDGWFTTLDDSGTEITESYTQSTVSEITVYAHWIPMTYVMTFNANGGSCDELTRTCMVDTPIGEPPVPTRSYYDFAGWYTEGENSVHVTASYQQASTEAITVYARWTPHEYTMFFDPNEGNCTTESIVGIVDAEIDTLPEATRDYYEWDGWYTAKTGGSRIDVGYVHDTDSDITAYAHWTPHTYTMTFDVNIGEATCSTQTKQGTVDASIGTLPTPEKPYYSFIGWFTERAGGTQVTSAYVQNTDEPITVYAQWTPGTYTITLDANGGSCSTTSKTGTVDVAIGALPEDVTRELYDFKGWYTAAAGGDLIAETYMQSTTDDFTVYAHWEVKKFTISFALNDSAGSHRASMSGSSTRYYPAAGPIGALPEPTRDQYTFDGWYTAATGGTKITSTYNRDSLVTLPVYAHWTPYTFTLKFNPNGGSVSTTTKQCSVDTAIGQLPTPSRDYYTFNGWYTATSGGSKIESTATYSTNSSVAIYAQWTLKPEKGWVTEDKVPSGAQITATSWSYRQSTESTASSMSGWTANGNYWKQSGTGSAEYASFPSGEYDTSNKYYKEMSHSPFTPSETATSKREVVNSSSPTGYIYWHWAINGTYSATAKRVIAYKKGTYSDGYWYGYFYAIKSTTKCPKASSDYCTIGQYPSNGRTTYNCTTLINNTSIVPASDKTTKTSGLKTYRFYELPYYTSTYTDYVKTYRYYRDLSYQSTDPGNGSDISNKVKYVKYREK